MPYYIFKCSGCDTEVTRKLPKKTLKIKEQCNTARRKVAMTYVRTWKKAD